MSVIARFSPHVRTSQVPDGHRLSGLEEGGGTEELGGKYMHLASRLGGADFDETL